MLAKMAAFIPERWTYLGSLGNATTNRTNAINCSGSRGGGASTAEVPAAGNFGDDCAVTFAGVNVP